MEGNGSGTGNAHAGQPCGGDTGLPGYRQSRLIARMRAAVILVFLALAAPARAELREFCASRPGLGTPPCTIDAGHVMVETGLADWTLDDTTDTRTDTLSFGGTLIRIGVGKTTEVQLNWTPYGRVRMRDKATGLVAHNTGMGDVTIGLRQGLSGPGGLIAIQPYVSLPTGGSAIGAGDWSVGVIVPIAFDLSGDVELLFSPQIAAVANADQAGRHLSYANTVSLSAPIIASLTGTIEVQALRDEDPAGATTQMFESASLAWMLDGDTQLDIVGR